MKAEQFRFYEWLHYYDELTPDVTSYDYDAVLTEAGDFTVKYENTEVIGKYTASPGNFFNGYKKEKITAP